MICAYGFLAILCVFLIFAYQILGEFVKFLSTWGRMLPRGRFFGARRHGDFEGLYRRFVAWAYTGYCLGVARLYSGPIWGLARGTKKPPAFAGGVVALVIYCVLLSGIRPHHASDVPRLFQRCGRAFCLRHKRELRQLT